MAYKEIMSFQNRIDAEMAKGLLEDGGVPSMIKGDDIGGLYPNLQSIGDGYVLLVNEQDVAQAVDLLGPVKTAANPED